MKRALSWLLCLALVLQLAPAAFAEETEAPEAEPAVTEEATGGAQLLEEVSQETDAIVININFADYAFAPDGTFTVNGEEGALPAGVSFDYENCRLTRSGAQLEHLSFSGTAVTVELVGDNAIAATSDHFSMELNSGAWVDLVGSGGLSLGTVGTVGIWSGSTINVSGAVTVNITPALPAEMPAADENYRLDGIVVESGALFIYAGSVNVDLTHAKNPYLSPEEDCTYYVDGIRLESDGFLSIAGGETTVMVHRGVAVNVTGGGRFNQLNGTLTAGSTQQTNDSTGLNVDGSATLSGGHITAQTIENFYNWGLICVAGSMVVRSGSLDIQSVGANGICIFASSNTTGTPDENWNDLFILGEGMTMTDSNGAAVTDMAYGNMQYEGEGPDGPVTIYQHVYWPSEDGTAEGTNVQTLTIAPGEAEEQPQVDGHGFTINGVWFVFTEDNNYVPSEDVALPQGVSYDYATQTLTLNSAQLESLSMDYSWYDEATDTSGYNFSHSGVTIYLEGESRLLLEDNGAIHTNQMFLNLSPELDARPDLLLFDNVNVTVDPSAATPSDSGNIIHDHALHLLGDASVEIYGGSLTVTTESCSVETRTSDYIAMAGSDDESIPGTPRIYIEDGEFIVCAHDNLALNLWGYEFTQTGGSVDVYAYDANGNINSGAMQYSGTYTMDGGSVHYNGHSRGFVAQGSTITLNGGDFGAHSNMDDTGSTNMGAYLYMCQLTVNGGRHSFDAPISTSEEGAENYGLWLHWGSGHFAVFGSTAPVFHSLYNQEEFVSGLTLGDDMLMVSTATQRELEYVCQSYLDQPVTDENGNTTDTMDQYIFYLEEDNAPGNDTDGYDCVTDVLISSTSGTGQRTFYTYWPGQDEFIFVVTFDVPDDINIYNAEVVVHFDSDPENDITVDLDWDWTK